MLNPRSCNGANAVDVRIEGTNLIFNYFWSSYWQDYMVRVDIYMPDDDWSESSARCVPSVAVPAPRCFLCRVVLCCYSPRSRLCVFAW